MVSIGYPFLGAFKNSSNLDDFLLVCEADAKGRTGLENLPYPQAVLLKQANQAAISIDTSSILTSNIKGAKIGEAIHSLRTKAVTEVINNYKQL